MSTLIDALILGIVEGLTEFLPISSTGHLILAGDLLNFAHPGRDVFYVAIQTGAMLAVVWEYRARFFRVDVSLWRNLVVAFVPAAVLGVIFGDLIKDHLFKPVPVALAFIVGGLIILAVDRGKRHARIERTQDMTWLDALKVGFAQCFAMIPGTSRSGATIIAALLIGVERRAAAGFSFVLAIPTMLAATAYSLWKARAALDVSDFGQIAVGLATSFVVALLVVRAVLAVIGRIGFAPFGWYRIALGLAMLAVLALR